MGEVAAGIRESLRPATVLVSLAPKLTIAKLTDLLGGFARIARMIPNAPSLVGCGYNPVAFGEALTDEDKADLLELLSAVGEAPIVAEETLEAYAVLTAMGPTHLWFQLYELRALAESFGLRPEAARKGLTAMVTGALATMNEAGLSAEEVLDLVPVKPLGDAEAGIGEAYRTKLTGVMAKIRP